MLRIGNTRKHGYVGIDGPYLRAISGDIFDEFEVGPRVGVLDESDLLPPIIPGSIYGFGANHHEYSDFLIEIGREPIPQPVMFRKGPEAAVGAGGRLLVPKEHAEGGLKGSGELAVYLKKPLSRVTPQQAADAILGYSIAFDAIPAAKYRGAADEDDRHASKGYPTFCPLGPWITIGVNADDLMQRTYYDNALILEGSTAGFVWSVPEAISRLSHVHDLEPGDVVLMGAAAPPANVRSNWEQFDIAAVKAGSSITVQIEELGQLTIPVENAR